MKPTTKQLDQFLQELRTPDQVLRVEALKKILGWYESFVPFVRKGFSPEQERRLQKALKARSLGLGGQSIDEQETALRMAARLFGACLDTLPVPSTETIYSYLSQNREELEREQQKTLAKVQPILDAMTAAFGPLGIQVTASAGLSGTRQVIDPTRVVYSTKFLSSLKTPQDAVLSELETAVKMKSLESFAGSWGLNPKKTIDALGQVMSAFRSWLTGTPIQFVPNPAPNPAPNPKPSRSTFRAAANPYRGMKAEIFEALKRYSGQEVDLTKLMAGIPAKDPKRMLSHIAQDGKTSGRWSLTFRKNFILFQEN